MLRAIVYVLLAIVSVTQSRAREPLRVAAAADLEPLLPPILKQFQQTTGIVTTATYQSSATLTTQIQNGAPFDLFLSADTGFPQRLIEAGVAEGPKPTTYARGTLVLWTRKDSRLPLPSLDLFRNPALKRLSIANPDSAPYGRAAVAALNSLRLYDELKPRLVIAQNIGQAAQFVDSGNADAGLISLTSAMTPRLTGNGSYFLIPRNLYPPIEQSAVVLKRTQQQPAARKLLDYLLTPSIQAELALGGLTPVN